MIILYFSVCFFSDVGTPGPGADDIVRRSSISSERLANTFAVSDTHGTETEGNLHPVVLNRFLP